MLKYAATLAAFLATGVAIAEELPQDLFLPVNAQCMIPGNRLLKIVKEQYGEQEFAEGTAIMTSAKTGQSETAVFTLYVNPDEKTWSLVTFMDQGPACLISSGTGFAPAINTTY